MKITFPLLALSLLLSVFAFAQNPVFIASKTFQILHSQQDWTCNNAGTIEVGQFIGQSNDTDLDQIFLCLGDSILIEHQGDADLSGDPNPSTVPGIGYSFYNCPPTVSGPSLTDVTGDPCILPGALSGLFVTQGVPNGGDTWFFNNGSLQNTFNGGQPLSLFFAPITMDNFASNTYEAAQIGMPPGPCVNVNIDEAFEVVYLNKITATGITNNFADDCIGKFTVKNGYPQWDLSSTFSIDISLASDPAVKAQVMNFSLQLFHLASVLFSATEPGLYNITIEDGKSCGHQFQMDMGGCTSSDNIRLDFGEVAGNSGEVVCVPLRVENFKILDGVFAVCWDSTLLKFIDIENVHPAIADFFALNGYQLATPADLRLIIFDVINGMPISIPDGEVIFDICFEVLDTLQDCTPVGLCNTVSAIIFEDTLGFNMAVTGLPGGVCKSVATSELGGWELSKIFPNPLKAGEPAYLNLVTSESTSGQLIISNTQGSTVQASEVALPAGENRIVLPTEALSPGVYFITFIAEDRPIMVYKVLVF